MFILYTTFLFSVYQITYSYSIFINGKSNNLLKN
nr:MAG TPA: hypothetical protein [Caudoviricetes sp.]